MPTGHDPYANFADLYDSECDNEDVRAFYSEFRKHLLDAIHQYRIPVRVLADLACGTGNSTVPWTEQKGWTVIGVDRSLPMLRQARKKTKREIRVQEAAYTRAEMRNMLHKAGLKPLKISVQRKLEGRPIRLLYLARKS